MAFVIPAGSTLLSGELSRQCYLVIPAWMPDKFVWNEFGQTQSGAKREIHGWISQSRGQGWQALDGIKVPSLATGFLLPAGMTILSFSACFSLPDPSAVPPPVGIQNTSPDSGVQEAGMTGNCLIDRVC